MNKVLIFAIILCALTSCCPNQTTNVTDIHRYFDWRHDNQHFSIHLYMERSIYDKYEEIKRSFHFDSIDANQWGVYLERVPEDLSIGDLAIELKKIAKSNNYNDKELVDLVASFIQDAIDHDYSEKEKLDKQWPYISDQILQIYKTPFQVLYQKKGVNLDKSILGHALLSELGFGTALINLAPNDKEKKLHVGFAIKCTKPFGIRASDYLFIEATAPRQVGSVDKVIDNTDYYLSQIYLRSEGKKYW